jgi:glucose-1-phosphate thymidylyltransferase
MKAIIIAAGYATRLYPLTLNKPKALLEVGNQTVLDYIIDEVETITAVNEIFIVSNHKFAKHFTDWRQLRNSVKKIKIIDDGTISDETKLGAIGDISLVIEKENINEDILVIAGDNLFTFKLMDFYNFYLKTQRDCILVQENENIDQLKAMGVVSLNKDNKVLDFKEKSNTPISNVAVYASYIYMKNTLPLILQYLNEKNNPDSPGYFPAWLYDKKDIYAYRFQGECYDIGTHKSYDEVKIKYDNDKIVKMSIC